VACGVMLLPALVLAFSDALRSLNVTVYVPYSTLKSVFPYWALL
jgi:hypothetical protein